MLDTTVTSRDGTELAVRDHGGVGPDVLFLHGRSRSLADWGPMLSHLDGIRAVSMDICWHGRSATNGTLDFNAFVDDFDAVVHALGLRLGVIVGHSFSGVIATYYAASHACAGVLNIDGLDHRMLDNAPASHRPSPPARRAGPDHGDRAWYLAEVERMRQDDVEFGVPEHVIDEYIERAFAQDPDGTWFRQPPRAFYESDIAKGAEPYATVLDRSTCPVIVLLCTGAPKTPSARDEPMAAVRNAMLRKLTPLAAGSERLRVETIDGSHAVIWEKPDEIAALVRSLL